MQLNEKQKEQVKKLLIQFNGAEEVAAILECEPEELDGVCMDAFGVPFGKLKSRCAAQGRALLRSTLMQQALNEGGHALGMLAREQLGIDNPKSQPEKQEAKVTPLDVIIGKREDRQARAANKA